MNRAETTPLKPGARKPEAQSLSPLGFARRLFDDWCDVVAPCPWTATAGRRAIHAKPLISSHP